MLNLFIYLFCIIFKVYYLLINKYTKHMQVNDNKMPKPEAYMA